MESIRITMVGISGSGKTSFLSAVHQTMMNTNIYGFDKDGGKITVHLTPNRGMQGGTGLVDRVNVQGDLDNILITPGRFPEGSEDTREFNLTMCVNNESVCPISFIDYKGGVIGSLDNAQLNVEDADETRVREDILEKIKQSSVLLIFADAIHLSRYESELECRSKVGANRVNTIFSVLNEEFSCENLCVLILLTKCDSEIIPPEDKENNFFRLSQKAVKMFSIAESVCNVNVSRKNWTFGVVPVTAIGKGNVVTVPFGAQYRSEFISNTEKITIAPENIDTVMLYSVNWALRDLRRRNTLRRRALEAETADLEKNNKGLKMKLGKQNAEQKELLSAKLREAARLDAENEKLLKYCDKIGEVFGEKFAANVNCRIEPSSRPVMT